MRQCLKTCSSLPNYLPFYCCFFVLLTIPLTFGQSAAQKAASRRRVEEAAKVRKYPIRSWGNAYTYRSKYYDVRSNTSRDVASYIGQLMDFAQLQYRGLFNFKGPIPRLKVYAYRTLREYRQVAKKVGLPDSVGLFSQHGGESIIYLPYLNFGAGHTPTSTLLHEGTHQFVHAAIAFPIPKRYQHLFQSQTLPSIPLWLNEGMATYMENAYFDGEELVTGELNVPRLRQLQYEMIHKRSVHLEQLFKASQREFNSSHYAAAWGVCYWFLHDRDDRKQQLKRKIFKSYLDACRNAFFNDVDKEFPPLLTKGDPKYWYDHIRQAGLKTLIQLTFGPKGSFQRWEGIWQKWILQLDPNRPQKPS